MQCSKWLFVAAIAAFAIGCATAPGLPGQVETSSATAEGHTEVRLTPGVVNTPGSLVVLLNLGAQWSSRKPDSVRLIAQVPRQTRTIRGEEGLQFDLGGETFAFDSPDEVTEIEGGLAGGSRRSFNAPLSFVERVAASEDVRMTVFVGETQYYEGRLDDGVNSAYRGLRRFVEAVHDARSRPVGVGPR